MHTSRSQDTGENIVMDDSKLYGDQMSRRSQHRIGQPQIDIRVGDTVMPILSQPKHKSRDMYIVTAAADQSVSAQKILHPLQNKPTKLMSRIYNTDPKNVQLQHHPSMSSTHSGRHNPLLLQQLGPLLIRDSSPGRTLMTMTILRMVFARQLFTTWVTLTQILMMTIRMQTMETG